MAWWAADRRVSRASAKLGYGMNPDRGPFDRPPAEPADLDPDELPWELRDGGECPPDGEKGR